MISLIYGISKQTKQLELVDTEKRWVVAKGRGWGESKMGEGGQKWYKLPVTKYASHGDVMSR